MFKKAVVGLNGGVALYSKRDLRQSGVPVFNIKRKQVISYEDIVMSLSGLSKTQVRRLIKQGAVTVLGEQVRLGELCEKGNVVVAIRWGKQGDKVGLIT